MALRETDILTGLYTPGFLVAFGARELASAKETGSPLSLISIGVDEPGKLDESFRPEITQDVVRKLVNRISRVAGDGAIVARVGDGEIAVLLPGTGSERAAGIAYRIKQVIMRNDRNLPWLKPETISIGVVSTSGEMEEFSDLMHVSRTALEKSKGTGTLVIMSD